MAEATIKPEPNITTTTTATMQTPSKDVKKKAVHIPPKRSGNTKIVSKSHKAKLIFPVGRLGRRLKEGLYTQRVGAIVPVYTAAVLQYITEEIFSVAEEMASTANKQRITSEHIISGMRKDDDLGTLIKGRFLIDGGIEQNEDLKNDMVKVMVSRSKDAKIAKMKKKRKQLSSETKKETASSSGDEKKKTPAAAPKKRAAPKKKSTSEEGKAKKVATPKKRKLNPKKTAGKKKAKSEEEEVEKEEEDKSSEEEKSDSTVKDDEDEEDEEEEEEDQSSSDEEGDDKKIKTDESDDTITVTKNT
jgi:histone H2A